LDLDNDYDGYVTVEDMVRFFGSENKDLNFNDLKKLI
jgi:Ca2+-binding EF-hand superfamily protein